MKTEKHIALRYGETDQMGVIHHANYILYFEDARTAFLEELGYPYRLIEEAGFMSPVVSVEARYGQPLVYGKGTPLSPFSGAFADGQEFIKTRILNFPYLNVKNAITEEGNLNE